MVYLIALIALCCLATPAAADFISAFLVTAAGLTGTAALIGQAVIGVGMSLGLGYLARRLQPQQSTQARGMTLSMSADVNESREILFGKVATGGALKYWNTYGPNGNDYLQLVIVLADHECDALDQVYVDGKPVTLQSAISNANVTGQPVAEYPGKMWIKFHSGAPGQTADADLVAKAAGGAWPSAFRGAGVCYVRVTMLADPEVYKTGRPSFRFVVRGAKLYDVRKDSTAGGSGSHRFGTASTHEWSDNAFVSAYHYRRGFYVEGQRLGGMNTQVPSLPVGPWSSAMNASDESVSLKGGGSERRYRANANVPVSSDHRSVLREFISSAAGIEVDSGGYLKPYAGVAQSPVMTITDDDMIVDGEFVYTPKLSRSQLINAVYGSFHDPAQAYESNALPPRISPDDEESDGGIQLSEHYALAYVTSGTQGQRICEILRRKGRFQRRVQMKLRSRFCVLEAGDWVTVSSDRLGFEDLAFEVEQAAYSRDLTTTVVLKETSNSIFSWTAADDELDPTNPAEIPAGGATFTTVEGVDLDAFVAPGSGDEQRPSLRITWTPITDATVVSLALEYRIIGDTVANERAILNPGAGSYKWLDGVQGGVTYEARLKPVTRPERGTVWSAWVSSASEAPPQVVGLAVEALYIDPSNIPPAELDAQSKLELARITAAEAIQGSLSAQLLELRQALEATAQAAMGSIAQHDIEIRQVRGSADGNTVSVTEVLAVVDGVQGRYGVTIDVNGRIVGAIQLDGTNESSNFTVLADNFAVGSPGKPDRLPFIVNDDGIFLDGVVVQNGSLSAEKINANTLYTLYITDPNNNYYYNFATGRQGTTDGLFLIDSQQGEIRITSPQPLDYRYAVNSGYLVPVLF